MKKKIQYFIFGAIILGSTSAKAQPAAVVKAAKAVFTLTTFKKDGSLLASSHGVFVGNNGEAITLWNPLKGADKAVIIDANGNKQDRKSTRLNSSHANISYAVFCLKKKKARRLAHSVLRL